MLTSLSLVPCDLGKVHWIDWCLFCDRLDDALKPLRNPKSQFKFWKIRRRPIKAQVLKNLQKVCEKEVQKQPILQDFVLYCPSPSRKSHSVANWHIQVIVQESSASSAPPKLEVPACISFPTSASANFCTRSSPLQQQNSSIRWPDIDTVETVPSSSPFELPPAQQEQRQGFRSRSSSISSNNDFTNLQNPFEEPLTGVSPAISQDGLLALDRQYRQQNHFWMSAPSLGGNYQPDTMPIPMAPPAPYTKTAA